MEQSDATTPLYRSHFGAIPPTVTISFLLGLSLKYVAFNIWFYSRFKRMFNALFCIIVGLFKNTNVQLVGNGKKAWTRLVVSNLNISIAFTTVLYPGHYTTNYSITTRRCDTNKIDIDALPLQLEKEILIKDEKYIHLYGTFLFTPFTKWKQIFT